MTNWNKKVIKAAKGELQPGEKVVASVFLQPSGTMGQAVGKGVGGVIGKAAASKMSSATDTVTELVTDSGIAASFRNEPTVLALTDHRLLVFGYSQFGGKPKGLKGAHAAGVLASVDTEKQKATHRFVMHFNDGTASVFEAPRVANDPEGFAAAVNAS
jgi:hypothetical protein